MQSGSPNDTVTLVGYLRAFGDQKARCCALHLVLTHRIGRHAIIGVASPGHRRHHNSVGPGHPAELKTVKQFSQCGVLPDAQLNEKLELSDACCSQVRLRVLESSPCDGVSGLLWWNPASSFGYGVEGHWSLLLCSPKVSHSGTLVAPTYPLILPGPSRGGSQRQPYFGLGCKCRPPDSNQATEWLRREPRPYLRGR